MRNDRAGAFRILALAWLGLLIISCGLWIHIDQTGPREWDPSRHARNALAMLDILRDVGHRHTFLDFIYYYDFYPPLNYVPAVVLHLLFGRGYDVACWSLLVFWIPLLFVSTVKSTSILLNRRAGWLAGFIVTAFPTVIALSNDFLTDLQTASMSAATLWILLRSNMLLTVRKWRAVQVGLVLGACMLVKWSMPVFLMGPLLIAANRGLRKIPSRVIGNGLLAALVAGAIAGPWYYLNRRDLVRSLFLSVTNPSDLHYPELFSFDSLVWYGRSLLGEHLLVPLTVLLVTGMIVLFRRERPIFWHVLISVGVAYAVLTMVRNKEMRFAAAFLPYLAIAMSAVANIRMSAIRGGMVALGVVASCANLYGMLFRLPFLPTRLGVGALTVYNQEAAWWMTPPRRQVFDPGLEAELVARSIWTCIHAGHIPQAALMEVRSGDIWNDPYRISYYGVMNGDFVRPAIGPDAPFRDVAGWPETGPLDADFFLGFEENPTIKGPRYREMAAFGSQLNGEGPRLTLAIAIDAFRRSGHAPFLGIYTDQHMNNSLCLEGADFGRILPAASGQMNLRLQWVTASRGAGRRFEYVRRLEAEGPTPFEISWIGPTTWELGERKFETVSLDLPSGTSPGRYKLFLKIDRRPKRRSDPVASTRLSGFDVNDVDRRVRLGEIHIR